MFHKPLGGKSLSQQQEMVLRKRSCEGIGIIDIKTTYWGSNSCMERIAFIGLMLLKTLRIMSDSLRPHGLQPTRLLCLWDFPGKNTGVGCHSSFRGSSRPRDLTGVPHIQADSLLSELPGKPCINLLNLSEPLICKTGIIINVKFS